MKNKEEYPDSEILFTDFCNNLNKQIQYIKLGDDLDPVEIYSNNLSYWNIFQRIKSLIKDIFLPKGYPYSVSSDYLEYQVWDFCQAFCSSICGTLTVRAVMKGIGVGSNVATPMSAAFTWIMKDGTGMVGSIMFAWLKGSKLDSDCKKWRLFADILNDIAMFIELSIPIIMDYSMYMLCIATVFKALVGTAGSSTRAAIVTHQAIKGNIADVSAKDGSQELFTNLFGFIFGIFLLKNVNESNQVWTVMCMAAVFHLIFNYKAVRCLKINVFNGERLRLTLLSYLPTSCVPTIEQVNRREPVILGCGTSDYQLCGFKIKFGVSVNKAVKSEKITNQQLSTLTNVFQSKKYFIIIQLKQKIINVAFRNHFSENDVLKAYFHAINMGIAISIINSNFELQIIKRSRKNSPIYRLRNHLEDISNQDETYSTQNNNLILKAYIFCENLIDKEFTAFSNLCSEEGWKINKHLINIDEWRGDWKYVAPDKSEAQNKKLQQKKNDIKPGEKIKLKGTDFSNLIIS